MAVYEFSKSKQGQNKVTEHFTVSEFACHDGSDYVPIDVDLAFKLEDIRQHFGKPITITSAYRTPSYNKKIGGTSDSYHVKGQAFDIVVSGVSPYDVAHYAQGLWINGIGCYYDSGFVHIDGRKKPYYWKNQSVTSVGTFDNLPSCVCNVRNVRLAHMADGWSFPQYGLTWDGNDDEFRYVIKNSVVKESADYSNVAKIVQYTVGADTDGIFGKSTTEKVKQWQKSHSLTVDGVWGESCWLKALGMDKKEEPTPTPEAPKRLTVVDALKVLQASVGQVELSADEINRLDCDGDGKLTVTDALIILQETIK